MDISFDGIWVVDLIWQVKSIWFRVPQIRLLNGIKLNRWFSSGKGIRFNSTITIALVLYFESNTCTAERENKWTNPYGQLVKSFTKTQTFLLGPPKRDQHYFSISTDLFFLLSSPFAFISFINLAIQLNLFQYVPQKAKFPIYKWMSSDLYLRVQKI